VDATAASDVGGVVALDIPPNGSVSLVDPDALRVTTYFAVKDGASVKMVRAPVRKNPVGSIGVQMNVPSFASAQVEVGRSCESLVVPYTPGTSVTFISGACPNQTKYDLVAVAVGTKVGGIPGAVAGVGTLSGVTAGVAVPAYTISPVSASGIGTARSSTNVPQGAQGIFRIVGRKNGVRMFHRDIDMANGGAVEMPLGPFDAFDLEQIATTSLGGSSSLVQHHVEHAATLANPGPLVTMPTAPVKPLATSDADPVAGTLPYQLSGTPLADAVVLDATQTNAAWTVVIPPSASGTVVLPALPAGLDSFKLGPIAGSGFVYTVSHVDDTVAQSYDELLANGWAFEGESMTETKLVKIF
jgi:hypothetical protein